MLLCVVLSCSWYYYLIFEHDQTLSSKNRPSSHTKHTLSPFAEPFFSKADALSPISFLRSIRLKSIDQIIFGHLNINSIRNKLGFLHDFVKDQIDILLVSETKIDDTFPNGQFFLSGYNEPVRLDRTAKGGGLLLYVRQDIPCKVLSLDSNIECITVEIRISKVKWLLLGTYNPSKSLISNHLVYLEKIVTHFMSSYDNIIILGDFNCEMKESMLDEFSSLFNLKNLVKSPTCFKSKINPTCIDLILTNKTNNFKHTCTIETGLSDFHLLTVTVLKSKFKKGTAQGD